MVDKNVVVSRIEKIDKPLERISSYNKLAYKDYLKDVNPQDIVEYNLGDYKRFDTKK